MKSAAVSWAPDPGFSAASVPDTGWAAVAGGDPLGGIFDGVPLLSGKLCIAKALLLSLTFGHRVVIGAKAVRFLNAIVTALAESSQREAE